MILHPREWFKDKAIARSNVRTLRDSGCRDQNNAPIHPSARGGYPRGQWLYFEVDLSTCSVSLVGKEIARWIVAYDNGNNGATGQFRAYFDNLRVDY